MYKNALTSLQTHSKYELIFLTILQDTILHILIFKAIIGSNMTHKDGNIIYMIVEFSDGLQIVPAKWLNNIKETCIWPSHFKTQLRINKAVITGEMPKERCDWQELEVKRIFGSASN